MADEAEYTQPDLSIFGEAHVKAYRETDGEQGYLWNGAPILLLTTTGRKSGEQRTSALIFGRDGDDLLLVASKGGAPDHPLWYLNLDANPEVEVQVKGEVFAATAHDAAGDEKTRLWSVMTDIWPNYDAYQERTDREIPLVVLTPKS
jgi:deazaflavin-dependent oxidoreductase (nitroreductase family)